MRKDNQRISLEFSIVLIRDDGEVTGAAAIIRDVTARWERERQHERPASTPPGPGPQSATASGT